MTSARKRASWERVFDLLDDMSVAALQAVMDRIKPKWVTRIESCRRWSGSRNGNWLAFTQRPEEEWMA